MPRKRGKTRNSVNHTGANLGFVTAATLLTLDPYVGAPPAEEDDEPFEQKMKRLTSDLKKQFDLSH
ncbi:MAG: hypothetical protein JRI39_14570 [Deltaproteobacteria bacterium]|nr:hypothetical protein [Deltaproteobacteria bacterium]